MNKIIMIIATLILIFGTSANSQKNKKIVHFAYFEGGAYFMHKVFMGELRDDLERMAGDSIEILYLPNAYLSAGWDKEICKAMSHDIVRNKEIDIVMAAGPWVIEALIEAGFNKPIIGVYQFDPYLMGLIDSIGKPVQKNLTVNYRPNKMKSDMAALQRLFPAKSVGLLYFPSNNEFDNLRNKLYEESGQYGAVIHAGKEFSPKGAYAYFSSFASIKGKIQALYLPPLWGLEIDQMKNFIWEATNAKIPTFSSEGFLLVEKGATASNSFRPYRTLARFTAHKIIQIIMGAEPASLPTIYEEEPELCLNLESVAQLGREFSREDINDARIIPQLHGDSIPAYTISSAIEQAKRENSGYLGKAQLYQKALALVGNANNAYYPEITAGFSATHTNSGEMASQYENDFDRMWEAGISLQQRIFSFPAIKAIKAAGKNLEINMYDLKKSESDMELAVTLAYLSVLENEERLNTSNEIMDRLRLIRDDAVALHKIYSASIDDIAIAEARFVECKIEMQKIQSELKTSKFIFNTLINRPANDKFMLDANEFSLKNMAALVRELNDLVSSAGKEKKLDNFLVELGIKNSIPMVQSELAVGLKRDLLSAQQWHFLPELGFKAKYSYGSEFGSAIGERKDYWILGGELKIPLFGSKSGVGKKSLNAEIEQILFQKDSLRFALMQNILQLKEKLILQSTTIRMIHFAKNHQISILDSMQQRYYDGARSIYELLETSAKSGNMTISSVEEKYNFFAVYTELLHALGYHYLLSGSREEVIFFQQMGEGIK
jgi:outer membrane protein TolC/ABC-type uncharacterized transport system substrate-binding protein